MDDFYTNINMVAQVISPMLWVFFYLPAMKGKVIKHSKLFTATTIGAMYKRLVWELLIGLYFCSSYIDSMHNEYHCIILGIMIGVHLSQAVTGKHSVHSRLHYKAYNRSCYLNYIHFETRKCYLFTLFPFVFKWIWFKAKDRVVNFCKINFNNDVDKLSILTIGTILDAWDKIFNERLYQINSLLVLSLRK